MLNSIERFKVTILHLNIELGITALFSDRKGANGTTVSTTWYHVTFFGDNNQRAWVSQTNALKYEGPDAFLRRSKDIKSKTEKQKWMVPANKKKVPSICHKFS